MVELVEKEVAFDLVGNMMFYMHISKRVFNIMTVHHKKVLQIRIDRPR